MKEKIFNIIQIGDKSNRISRAFDIFITFTIICNIIVTFLETFDQLTSFGGLFTMLEHASVLIFCIEYALRIWTADYLYPEKTPGRARFCFLISFDGVVDLLTIIRSFFCRASSFSVCCAWRGFSICSGSMRNTTRSTSLPPYSMKNGTRSFPLCSSSWF